MKEIELTQGKVAIVDDEDFEWLGQWKWYASNNKYTWYARRTDYSGWKHQTIRMHRAILEYHGYDLTGLSVDHINHNGIDNRLKNLRPATQSQNQHNQRPMRGICEYKGVYWDSVHNKWRVQITANHHQIHLGLFDDKKTAAKIYNRAAVKLFGEFACLNKI